MAACQILVDGDSEAAPERIDRALGLVRADGAHIALFSEACLFGWVNPAAQGLPDPVPGATTERLGRLARNHGILLALGLAEKDGEHLHNAAVLIDRDGTLLLKHRKLNILSELMEPSYVSGESARDSVVPTRYGASAC